VAGVVASDDLLAILEAALRSGASPPAVTLEFSVRIGGGAADRFGRFGAWIRGDPIDSPRLKQVLEALGAPAAAHAALPLGTVRRGLAVSMRPVPEFRLYLHGRGPLGVDRYTAIRWRSGAAASASEYRFHYAPERADGVRPEALVHPDLRAMAAEISRDPRYRATSGFWLRSSRPGTVDQVDFAFPWSPPAGTLPAIAPLIAACDPSLSSLPVRHIAFPTAGTPKVTLYCAGPAASRWPKTEAQLQDQARAGASDRHARSAMLGATLDEDRGSDAAALDAFYGGPVAAWQAVLGPALHYHHGLFAPGDGPTASPDAMAAAMRRAVGALYPFIPAGADVYDIGCGWGGPLAMLVRDRGCTALGLTVSRTQFRHIAAMGLPVRWGDAERTLPPRRFDCVLMLDSFEHIVDKPRLLARLRPYADRLVMRVNCQDAAPPGGAFAGSMRMIASAELRAMVEAAGWRVRHWRDVRGETMLSHEPWYRRLRALPAETIAADPHLQAFETWCRRVLLGGKAWADNNPLIEFAAE
jgi:Methionine biosynthesis protein MetW